MPSTEYWERRAKRAETALADARKTIESVTLDLTAAQELLNGVQARVEDRAALMSIETEGRSLRLIFVRNNELTTIETYAGWGVDVETLRKKLLERHDG